MKLITSIEELKTNLSRLKSYLESNNKEHRKKARSLIKLGICFVVYKEKGKICFAPSRFVGYKGNKIDKHVVSTSKDGRITNVAISDVLSCELLVDEQIDEMYKKYCIDLGIAPGEKGAFGKTRKFWGTKIRL